MQEMELRIVCPIGKKIGPNTKGTAVIQNTFELVYTKGCRNKNIISYSHAANFLECTYYLWNAFAKQSHRWLTIGKGVKKIAFH